MFEYTYYVCVDLRRYLQFIDSVCDVRTMNCEAQVVRFLCFLKFGSFPAVFQLVITCFQVRRST